MAFDFILMLTANDMTIPDASARLDEALEGGVRHIGFKDVGLPFAELRGLAAAIRAAGGRSYLEVVSLDAEAEMASARAAVELDVDCLLGGTRADAVTAVIRDHPVRYYPFPGRITGHPSVLEGSEAEIADSARRLADLEHVHGLDLLAYRYGGDVPALMREVCAAVAKPVIVAGSIDREERVVATADAGAAGFTVGTAALEGAFPAEGEGFAAQVRALLAITARARRRSTAPRRIAIAAHESRKPHLRAWILRHAKALARHRLVCTGGTGAMVAEAAPGLSVQRLQRGTRGGDQQLGALVATAELDGVIFFADPTVPHGGDIDLQALTRLAIVHDTPIALSASAADMLVAALLPERGSLAAPGGVALPATPASPAGARR
jgi:methylglyoxal synthase